MSQQDPPPSGPVPPSGPPTQPAQPLPPAPPGQPGYGPPQTQAGYGAPGEPPHQSHGATSPGGPRKSRTGLIIGLVAGLVVLAAIIIAVALLAGGNDDTARDNDGSSPSTSASTSNSPSTSASESQAAGTLGGQGYSLTLADGWTDVTQEVLASNPAGAIDKVAAWGEKFQGARANLIVESGPANGQTDPEALRAQWEKNITSTTGGTAQPYDGRDIAGQQAIGTTVDVTNAAGIKVQQIVYLTIRDDKVYSIGFNGEQGDDAAQQAFQQMLDSWSWS